MAIIGRVRRLREEPNRKRDHVDDLLCSHEERPLASIWRIARSASGEFQCPQASEMTTTFRRRVSSASTVALTQYSVSAPENEDVRAGDFGEQAVGLGIAEQVARSLREDHLAISTQQVVRQVEGVVAVEQDAPWQERERQLRWPGVRSTQCRGTPLTGSSGLSVRLEITGMPLARPFKQAAYRWDDLAPIGDRCRAGREQVITLRVQVEQDPVERFRRGWVLIPASAVDDRIETIETTTTPGRGGNRSGRLEFAQV